jgi:hypothetical protein
MGDFYLGLYLEKVRPSMRSDSFPLICSFLVLSEFRDHVPSEFLMIFNGKKKGSTFADPFAIKLSLPKSN